MFLLPRGRLRDERIRATWEWESSGRERIIFLEQIKVAQKTRVCKVCGKRYRIPEVLDEPVRKVMCFSCETVGMYLEPYITTVARNTWWGNIGVLKAYQKFHKLMVCVREN